MDNYLNRVRFSDYFLSMANIEAHRLICKANEVSFYHLKDGFTQMAFQDDIKRFVDAQLTAIRSASTEKVCLECLQNLKQEHEYLSVQDRMLRNGQAALHASVQFIKSENVWGYIISGVGVVLGGLQMVAGFGVTAASFATGNIIGVGFGAMLVLHGANGVQEGFQNIINGTNDAKGFLKKSYIAGAEFLGFDQKTGELAYTSMDLLLSVYGMARLMIKPQAYRLFHFISTDYVRGITNMSRFDLGVEIYNDSMSMKTIYDEIKEN